MFRIVIDANVWIRFARSRSIAPIIHCVRSHGLTPVANRYLLAEVFDALVENKWMTIKAAMGIIHFIEETCLLTAENAVYRLSPDPKDNYLFDLAVQSNCAFIISDDTDLLSFTMQPVEVKSCNWFLKQFPV